MLRFRSARLPAGAATCALLLLAGCSDHGFLIDPHTGANVPYDGNGPVIVQMGQDYDGGGSGAVTVNLGTAQAGTYTGTVTLTVAVP